MMRSIAARLTFAYMLCLVVSMALLSFAGAQLIESRLVQASDAMVDSQYGRIRNHLLESVPEHNPALLEKRLRRLTDSAADLIYVDVRDLTGRTLFLSTNLKGQRLPTGSGARYSAQLDNIGDAVVSKYEIKPDFLVLVATSRHPVMSAMRSYVEIFAALCFVALIVGALTGFVMSQISLAPLRHIRETCARINLETLDARIPVSPVKDELSSLARLLNAMLDRLSGSVQHIRRFTADASHELKTPLTLMRLHVERLAADATLNDDQRATLDELMGDLTHLQHTISGLLLLSRVDSHTLPVSMERQSTAQFLEVFRGDAVALCEHNGCRFLLLQFGHGDAVFDARWVRQVLLNLLTNAIRASPTDGIVVVESTVNTSEWSVTMHDEGAGLAAEYRERIFERFVRAEASGEGAGLGLAICKSIIELHGGTIEATDGHDGMGLRVTFTIPVKGTESPLAAGLSISSLTDARRRRAALAIEKA